MKTFAINTGISIIFHGPTNRDSLKIILAGNFIANFSPSLKFKICRKFKISPAKITK
jgi:hypothetical protein